VRTHSYTKSHTSQLRKLACLCIA